MMRYLIFFILLMGCTGLAQGQALKARITQLAGNNIYLDIGTEAGVMANDIWQVNGNPQNQLKVVHVTKTQCVTAFESAPFPLTRGQEIDLLLVSTERENTGLDDGQTMASTDTSQANPASSIFEAETERRRRRAGQSVKVEGRLRINTLFSTSETAAPSDVLPKIRRTYVTPAINLNATVSRLPGDVKLHAHVRGDYRYQSRKVIMPETPFRTYRLSVEKTLGFGQVQAGRFYNRYMQRGGYIDGLAFMVGDKTAGIGGALGYEPERGNEGISTQLSKLSLFTHYKTKSKTFTYKVGAAYSQVQPADAFLDHKYTSIEQRIDIGPVHISQDLQIDRDPVQENWRVSQLQINVRSSITDWLDLSTRYALRQPFRRYSIDNPFQIRRDRYYAGLQFKSKLISGGSSLTLRHLNQEYEGRTIAGYVHTQAITPLKISLSSSFNHWESDFGTSIYASAGVARRLGILYSRLSYGFYRSSSPNVSDPEDIHRISYSGSIAIRKQLHLNLRGNWSQSNYLTRFSFVSSLQVRF